VLSLGLLPDTNPSDVLDVDWSGYERGVSSKELAEALALSTEQVERVIADIIRKQRTTAYLRTPPVKK